MKTDRFDKDIPITDFEGTLDPERFCEPGTRTAGAHRKASVLILGVLGVFLTFTAVYLILNSFKISNITVVGNKSYSEAEIIAAAGLNIDKKFMRYSSDEAEAALLEACPAVESVSIDKKFPSGVTVTVTEAEVIFYTFFGDKWYSLTDKLKAVEEARHADRFKERGLLLLELPQADGFEVGKTPTFGSIGYGSEYLWSFAEEFCGQKDRGTFDISHISHISLSEKFSITVFLNDGSLIILGSADNTGRKLEKASAVIDSMRDETEKPLGIDVTDPEKAICRVIE